MAPLIERNTTIPTRRSQIFSTATDNQTAVEIKVYQGERPMAADNKLLGTFELTGIRPAPRAVPQIEVTFDIDADGLLNVSAVDKETGRQQSITIRPSSGLSDSEIAEMIRQAEEHRAEDEARRERIAVQNQADSLIYTAERKLWRLSEQLDAATRDEIEFHLAGLRRALDGEDLSTIRARIAELAAALERLPDGPAAASNNGAAGDRSQDVSEDQVSA